MPEEKLSDYAISILKTITDKKITEIRYNKYAKDLGDIVKGKTEDDTVETLRELEHKGVLEFLPKGRASIYQVNSEEAEKLYQLYKTE